MTMTTISHRLFPLLALTTATTSMYSTASVVGAAAAVAVAVAGVCCQDFDCLIDR